MNFKNNQSSESNIIEQSNEIIELPKSSLVLTLGIISICFCWCYGFVGIAISVYAILLTKKAKQKYFINTKQYSIKSFKNLKTGYFCAMIGLILSALYLLFIFILLLINKLTMSTAFSSMPWDLL